MRGYLKSWTLILLLEGDRDCTTDMLEKNRSSVCFTGFSWPVKLQARKRSFALTLNKAVVFGSALESGDTLVYHSAFVDDRPALVLFLDREGRVKSTAST